MLDFLAPFVKSCRRGLATLRRLAPVLLWGVGLWVAVVVLPLVLLWPEFAPMQSVQWGLCGLAPVGLLIAGLSGQPLAVMGFGLLCLMPVVVACPELLGPRATGPLHALLVAVLVLGLVASTWRANWAATSPSQHGVSPSLARLWSRPRGLAPTLTLAWGVVALAMAWQLPALPLDDPEHARATRVAAAAVSWVALRRLPLAEAITVGRAQWAVRVGAVLGLFGMWWLWRQAA
jgi:hypothetical protein